MNYAALVESIVTLHRESLGRAALAVNRSLILRNWIIGAYLVEFEQEGADRATYGAGLLPRLSGDLRQRDIKGVSPDVLERMRLLYLHYPQLRTQISATMSRNLTIFSRLQQSAAISATPSRKSAAMRVHRLDWGSGKYPVRPVLSAVADAIPRDCTIPNGQISSRIWRSRTPFVPPRYFYRGNLHGAKLKAKDAPEQQLAQCLRQAGIDVPGVIRRLTLDERGQEFIPPLSNWDIVRTPEEEESRMDGVVTTVHVPANAVRKEKARRIGLFFEIAFDVPVTFNVPALGHSAHFGLGLFRAVPDA